MVNSRQSGVIFDNDIYKDYVASDDMYPISGILVEFSCDNKMVERRDIKVVKSFGDAERLTQDLFDGKLAQIYRHPLNQESESKLSALHIGFYQKIVSNGSEFGVVRLSGYKHTCIFKMMPSNKLFLLCIEDNAIFEQTYLDLMKSGHYDTFLDRMV